MTTREQIIVAMWTVAPLTQGEAETALDAIHPHAVVIPRGASFQIVDAILEGQKDGGLPCMLAAYEAALNAVDLTRKPRP